MACKTNLPQPHRHTKKTPKNPIVLVIGTRPEGIKIIPLYKALKKAGLPALLCSTMQHEQLLSQVFDIFDVTPDFNLNIMRYGQDLFYLTQAILQRTKEVFMQVKPSLVIVQGDTTSTMTAALSAFYLQIDVAHVEAGLRTGDLKSPFPEEANRKMVSHIAKYHFTPTQIATNNLLKENVNKEDIFLTGNTVVDALRIIKENITSQNIVIQKNIHNKINTCKKENKKIILLTTHRRESFDGGIKRILQTIKEYLIKNKNIFCFYPFHPNPNVIQAIEKTAIGNLQNIYLCEPIPYDHMVHLIANADLVLTDSGGIQEEAVALGKNVLVLRKKTERPEGVLAGLAHIVGTDPDKIKKYISNFIKNNSSKLKNNKFNTIYGDGYACEKIIEIIKKNMPLSRSVEHDKHDKEILNAKIIEYCAQESSKKNINNIGNVDMKKACVLGLGYIGLPTAIMLAENNFHVVGFDIDEKKVSNINNGNPMIEEPEIYEKLNIVLHYGRFKAITKIESADYFIIAVPTPLASCPLEGSSFTSKNLGGTRMQPSCSNIANQVNKKANMSYIKAAAKSICKVLKKGNTILLESTIPVGATSRLALFIQEKTKLISGKDFYIAHCPERVLPGKIFKELIENDRVIGGINYESAYKASLLYDTFVTGNIHLTDDKTAEMVKLVENSSRDAQIAFAHQVAGMANAEKINPYEVIELANKHPRVNILKPTCGVGGHCIAIDPWFLVESFPNNCDFIKSARAVNDKRPKQVIKIIEKNIKKWQLANNNKQCTVLLLGATYKPNVDDLRESPALQIAREMTKKNSPKNIRILMAEPHIKTHTLQKLFGNAATNLQEGISQADILVYLVSHKRFKAIDKKIIKNKLILDFCGITYKSKFDPEKYTVNGMLDFFITNSSDYCEKQNNGGHI